MRKQLTALVVKNAPTPDAGKRTELSDALVPGLQLRVTDKGAKSFVLRGRVRGQLQPIRLYVGDAKYMFLAEAREKALLLLREMKCGRDPRAAKQAEKAVAVLTVAEVAEQYINAHIAKLRTARAAESMIRSTIIAAWGKRPITAIAARDVADLVSSVAEMHPDKAQKVLNHTRAIFQWAMAPARAYVTVNPVAGMTAKRDFSIVPAPTHTALSNAHLRAIWRATEGLNFPGGAFVRFLLLSGQRRGEVAGMRWDELDLAANVWIIPGSRMKAGRPHEVPLSPQMVELIEAMPYQGTFVFSATGSRPFKTFDETKKKLDKLLAADDLPSWTFHDLRRAVRTGLGAIPSIPHDIRELVIAHVPDALVRTYDLHGYRDEKRAALSAWCDRLAEIVS